MRTEWKPWRHEIPAAVIEFSMKEIRYLMNGKIPEKKAGFIALPPKPQTERFYWQEHVVSLCLVPPSWAGTRRLTDYVRRMGAAAETLWLSPELEPYFPGWKQPFLEPGLAAFLLRQQPFRENVVILTGEHELRDAGGRSGAAGDSGGTAGSGGMTACGGTARSGGMTACGGTVRSGGMTAEGRTVRSSGMTVGGGTVRSTGAAELRNGGAEQSVSDGDRFLPDIWWLERFLEEIFPNLNGLYLVGAGKMKELDDCLEWIYEQSGLAVCVTQRMPDADGRRTAIVDLRRRARVPVRKIAAGSLYLDLASESEKQRILKEKRTDISYISARNYLDTVFKARYNVF